MSACKVGGGLKKQSVFVILGAAEAAEATAAVTMASAMTTTAMAEMRAPSSPPPSHIHISILLGFHCTFEDGFNTRYDTI